jgi:iron complex outermembrane receptor protein
MRIGTNNKNLAIAVLVALPAQGALAQQSPGDDAAVEEIIVTATKREESIYDVPVSVSAFSEETIQRQGITDLTDIGKFVPNMTVTGFSAGHVSSVNAFIRGIGLQDHLITTDPGVGVYVDGVYLGRQVGQNWSLANIERVEVLRGPQGTLYGRNTIGGAINIITRQPGEESGGRVTAQAGSRGRLGGDFYWNQPFTDTFAASITGAYTQRDGVGEFRNHAAARDVGELDEWNTRVAARWAPTEDFSLLLTFDKADGEGGLRPYYTLIDEVPNGLLYATGARNSDTASDHFDNNGGFYIDPDTGEVVDRSVVTNDADGWAVTADWAMNDALAWKFIYSDRSSDYESGLDDDSLASIANPSRDTNGDLLFPGTENGTVFSYPETGYADQQSAELQLTGDFGGWDFVAGLYQFEEEGGNRQDPNFFLGGPAVFINQQETDSRAVYGNVGFDVTDDLRLSVGARYTEDEKHAYTAPIVGLLEAENSRDWDQVTGELSASWDMTDRLNLYGTVQSGYQSGQYPARAYCLFGALGPNGVTYPNCYVAGENVTAINYETGLKGQPFDSLSMSAAVFYTDYTDLPYQVSNSTGTGFNTVNIIVDQTSQGFEWESSWAPTDNFLLHASLGFIDVEVDHANPNVVAPLTPDLTWSLSPEYTLPLNSGASLSFRADWSFRDDMYGEPSKDPVRMTQIESRDIVNFDVAYNSADGRWTLGVYGRNVTDEKYANAKLLPDDYLLIIMNNDLSEFGLRFLYNFEL